MSTRSTATVSMSVILAFASIYIIWGTTYLGIAFAIQTIPPFIAGGVRFVIAAMLMYLWLRIRGGQASTQVSTRASTQATTGASAPVFVGVNLVMASLCGVLLSGIGNGFVIWAQQGIPSGVAALIVCFMPVLVLILDWIFFAKQAPTPQAMAGTAIAVAGVATIVAHTHDMAGSSRTIYLVAMFAATIGWSFGTLLQKRAARAQTVLSFTCVQMFAGGVFQLVMATFDGEWRALNMSAISPLSLFAVAYLIVFGSIVALNAYLWLLTRVSAQKVTTYALVNPVVALLLGALFLQERITPLTLMAAALVLIGVALVLFQGAHPAQLLHKRRPRAALRDVPGR